MHHQGFIFKMILSALFSCDRNVSCIPPPFLLLSSLLSPPGSFSSSSNYSYLQSHLFFLHPLFLFLVSSLTTCPSLLHIFQSFPFSAHLLFSCFLLLSFTLLHLISRRLLPSFCHVFLEFPVSLLFFFPSLISVSELLSSLSFHFPSHLLNSSPSPFLPPPPRPPLSDPVTGC